MQGRNGMRRFVGVFCLACLASMPASPWAAEIRPPSPAPGADAAFSAGEEAQRNFSLIRPFLWGAADAVNAFSLDLFSKLPKAADENIVISPYSLDCALALVAYGSRGDARDEFLSALRLSAPYPVRSEDSVHFPLSRLSAFIAADASLFSSASLVAHAPGLRLKKSYVAGIAANYSARAAPIDFAAAGARHAINRWASERTGGAIRELLPESSLASDTKLLVLNASSFKGEWATAFPVDNTTSGLFLSPDGGMKASYMSVSLSLPVVPLYDDDLDPETGEPKYLGKLTAIPFAENGWEMAFFHPESMDAFMKRLNPKKLCEWLASFDSRSAVPAEPVRVVVPKFAFSGQFESLADALKEMGVVKAFASSGADFSGIADGSLCLTGVLHAARVEVDEAGVKTTAASAVMMGKGLPQEFLVDSPFVFMIRHVESGAIVMLGRVMRPVIE